MFSNPFYCGLVYVKPHRSSAAQMVEGRHEPLISRELWEECQRIADTSEHTNDGKMLRLNIPTLTEERRKEMVKHVKKVAEDFRVSIRNDRRDAMEKIKKAEKDKTLSEDDRKNAEHTLQHVTDLYIKKIDETLAIKEKDILEI
jgi:ribosome recycling factor